MREHSVRFVEWVRVGAVLLATAAVAQPGTAPEAPAAPPRPPEVGDRVSRPRVETYLGAAGESSPFATWPGDVTVLHFWATWCTPCIADMPRMNGLVRRFADRPIRFVSITDETAEIVAPFLARRPIEGWVGLDLDRSVFEEFGISGLPWLVVIDARGRIALTADPRALTAEVLEAVIAGRSVVPPVLAAAADPGASVSIDQTTWEEFRRERRRRTDQILGDDEFEMRGTSLVAALARAWGVEQTRIRADFLFPAYVYDIHVAPIDGTESPWAPRLRRALEARFGIEASIESREVDVPVLSAAAEGSHRLRPGTPPSKMTTGGGRLAMKDSGVDTLVYLLGLSLRRHVINETGIEGKFDCELTWDYKDPATIEASVAEQLGLRLETVRRPLEVLVVRKKR